MSLNSNRQEILRLEPKNWSYLKYDSYLSYYIKYSSVDNRNREGLDLEMEI